MVRHTQQFVGNLPTNCLNVFDHFAGLALKGLRLLSGIYIGIYHNWNVLSYLIAFNLFYIQT